MNAGALQIVQSYLADHAVEWLSEQVEFHDMTQPEPMHGRAEVARFLGKFYRDTFSDAHVDELRLTADGERVCVEWVFRGRHTGSLAGEEPTGRKVAQPMACVFEVAAGEIRRARLYYDGASLIHQLTATHTEAVATSAA
jgi:steroid delta-isomerase-like uncharacterized protein